MQLTLLIVLVAACCVMGETPGSGDQSTSATLDLPTYTGTSVLTDLPTPTTTFTINPVALGHTPTKGPALPPTTSARDGWTTISTLLKPTDTSRSISRATMPPSETTKDTSISKVAATATTTEKVPAPTVTVSAAPAEQKWYMNPWFHVVVTAVLTLALFTWPLILIGMWVQRRRSRGIAGGRNEGGDSIPLENLGTAV
jgi:hypothetical protein